MAKQFEPRGPGINTAYCRNGSREMSIRRRKKKRRNGKRTLKKRSPGLLQEWKEKMSARKKRMKSN